MIQSGAGNSFFRKILTTDLICLIVLRLLRLLISFRVSFGSLRFLQNYFILSNV